MTRLRAPRRGCVVRMYRHGLGDCFLIAFANGNGLVYDAATGQFLFSALVGVPNPQAGEQPYAVELYSLSPTGIAVSLGPTSAHFGGMAFTELIPVELQSFTVE